MKSYTKYAVNIAVWVAGSGWSYSETLEWLDDYCTAEEYIRCLDSEGCGFERTDGEDLLVTIVGYDYNPMFEDGDELSKCWLSDVEED